MEEKMPLSRQEVLKFLEKRVETVGEDFLSKPETNWQPADLLPQSDSEEFFDEIKTLQGQAENMSYDLLAVLIGDTITEEALPTYETWLGAMDGIDQREPNPWMRWIRWWSAEENRHGDVLNRYLYLCKRINMREFEASTQMLIADGFDIETNNDPYRTFVYTSFQEVATNISHRRVATLAKQSGNTVLAKICGMVASDEKRHAQAYQDFVSSIFEVDTNEMMLAFEDMMRKKIVMPAQYMRELGKEVNTFANFGDAAQRLGVYTAHDYVDIMRDLVKTWKIDEMRGLQENGEKARDYLMTLPDRMARLADRMKMPTVEHKFSWIIG
jgi:acyl-[acyl-carrier-protein] desaturase